jgi:hypothetical protein
VVFTDANAELLLATLRVAFTSHVREGLVLFRKNRNLLKEADWKPLARELVERFDNSLVAAFDAVIAHLLEPLLDNTRCWTTPGAWACWQTVSA